MKKIRMYFCIICLALCILQGVSAGGSNQSWNTPDGKFRDDNPALGIDHSQPNQYLAANLERKLSAAKTRELGVLPFSASSAVAQFTLPPGRKPAVSSKGTKKILVFLVDFPDYPHGTVQTVADADSKLNGPGDPDMWPTDNMHDFYARSSYNQLDLDSSVYGWYRAQHNRDYYTDNSWALFSEVMTAYDPQVNYADFDNDHDGDIDSIFLYWTGPDNGWLGFWWAYHTSYWYSGTPRTWDGVYIVDFCWEWYTYPWTKSGLFDANTPCHEMGHMLGLPDYYDYDGSVGPDGGVGGFDMMDANWVDHNVFSKYLLDWTTPVVVGNNPSDITSTLYPSGDTQGVKSVLIMPGAALNSFSEFFMVENRAAGHGNDPDYWSKNGLTIWHVDSTLDTSTRNFKYDNSYTTHKLLRLMEADGNEDIGQNLGWDENDIYGTGEFFGPKTSPSSYRYAGTDTKVRTQDIETGLLSDTVSARWMIGDFPPVITAISPATGMQNTLLQFDDLSGANFMKNAVVYFVYTPVTSGTEIRNTATNVSVESVNRITGTFDLHGVPPAAYTLYVENPDGETGMLAGALTVTSPEIQVLVPAGGEQWPAGTAHTISWSQAGLDGTSVRIELWKERPAGTFQREIAASVPAGAGRYDWTIPADVTPSARYWINITSTSNPSVSGATAGWLEITPVPEPALSLAKSISADNWTWSDSIAVAAGSTVYYNLTVINTGNCLLQTVSISDGALSAGYSRLEPGAAWHYYYSATAGSDGYTNTATASGTSDYGSTPVVTDEATYSIKSVLIPLPGFTKLPTDPDGDGFYEDLNGNTRKDFNDVVLYFRNMAWIARNEPVSAFDFNSNGRIDFNDIVRLFREI